MLITNAHASISYLKEEKFATNILSIKRNILLKTKHQYQLLLSFFNFYLTNETLTLRLILTFYKKITKKVGQESW